MQLRCISRRYLRRRIADDWRVWFYPAQVEDEATRHLLLHVREDEIRSCRGLLRSLREIEGTPSQVIGAFYEKAMVIADVRERLQLLERGQQWVARRIGEWLPGVANAAVFEQLQTMRDDHQHGISGSGDEMCPLP